MKNADIASDDAAARARPAKLGRAYWDIRDRTDADARPSWTSSVSTGDPEAIESLAIKRPRERVEVVHAPLLDTRVDLDIAGSNEEGPAFERLQEEALDLTLPATQVYLRHSQAIVGPRLLFAAGEAAQAFEHTGGFQSRGVTTST